MVVVYAWERDQPRTRSFTPQENRKMKMLALMRGLKRDTRGANMVEYIILVGIVALLAIAAFKVFNTKLQTKVNEQAGKVENIGN